MVHLTVENCSENSWVMDGDGSLRVDDEVMLEGGFMAHG